MGGIAVDVLRGEIAGGLRDQAAMQSRLLIQVEAALERDRQTRQAEEDRDRREERRRSESAESESVDSFRNWLAERRIEPW